MFDSIFTEAAETGASTLTWQGICIAIGTALILGLIISGVYMATNKQGYSQSFVLTVVILPLVITLIIMLVGSNVARAFSLAGAFSIIRFRTTMGSPKDVLYIFFTLAIGLALGMGCIEYGIVAAIFFCLIILVLSKLNYGVQKNSPKQLRVVLPENIDYNELFDDIFAKYTTSYYIVRVKTTDLGSLFEVMYNISLKKDINEKSFIDELRCRNGNLSISISVKEEGL